MLSVIIHPIHAVIIIISRRAFNPRTLPYAQPFVSVAFGVPAAAGRHFQLIVLIPRGYVICRQERQPDQPTDRPNDPTGSGSKAVGSAGAWHIGTTTTAALRGTLFSMEMGFA
ncbi:unnamed protein product [Heligmosomoides polygyrus]|uniref:Secreted protein n=1 Tax=Heligmosomoides polygyrus TaxID=6339 RepID=A0A183FXG4_HELPZ|nr:unnamed protein product [Heligmosomoides polygyrus]